MTADELEGVVDCVMRYRLKLHEVQQQLAAVREEAGSAEPQSGEVAPEKRGKKASR